MTILSIMPEDTAGQVGVKPRKVSILSTDSLAVVTATGYLNGTSLQGITLYPTDIIWMTYAYSTLTGTGTFAVFSPTFSNGLITIAEIINAGDVLLPVVSNHLALFHGTTGQIYDAGISPSNINKALVASINDATAGRIVHYLDDIGTITSSQFNVTNAGSILAGSSGIKGALLSYPATSATGALVVEGVSNSGDTLTTIRNASMAQASIVSIPDPGAATANFLLDAGPANTISDYQQIVGLKEVLLETVGSWVLTRNSTADYTLNHSAAAESSIVGFDITTQIRTAASHGFKLNSIDVMYDIATLALTAHTGALYSVSYANNAANTITSVPLTGSLATATQGASYVTNLAVTTPSFANTPASKYVFEISLTAQATTVYLLIGLNLHFSRTIS